MLRIRIISAFLLLPLVLLIVTRGPWWGVLLFLIASAGVCLHEMAHIALSALERSLVGSAGGGATRSSRRQLMPWLAVVLGCSLLAGSAFLPSEAVMGSLILTLFICLLLGEYLGGSIEQSAAWAFSILITVCYAGLPWLLIWQLYKMGENAKYLLLVMAITWMGDTGGYFGGRFFGGKIFGDRKLAPTISPKKTWEGAVSGLLLSVIGALTLNYVYGDWLGLGEIASPVILLIAAVLGGIFEQIGDLLESLFKRVAQVKDSGSIIPGHGGLLDRVDGVLFAAPVIWAVVYYGGIVGL